MCTGQPTPYLIATSLLLQFCERASVVRCSFCVPYIMSSAFSYRWKALAVRGWLVCFHAYHFSPQGKQRESGISPTLGSWYTSPFPSPSSAIHPNENAQDSGQITSHIVALTYLSCVKHHCRYHPLARNHHFDSPYRPLGRSKTSWESTY